jgi:[protein-PII] uridylyltransferase
MSFANLRPAVLQARDKLKAGREKLRQLHDGGALGVQVSNYLTELIDAVVLDLYTAALQDLGDPELPSLLALVPYGGYGRRDVSPFSDVDLMLLAADDTEPRVRPLAARLVQDICDSGLVLGQSLRTPGEACKLAMEDVTIFTSMVESRHLTGNERLFSRFFDRFRGDARRRHRSLIEAI